MSTHVRTGTCVSFSHRFGREQERFPTAAGSVGVHIQFLKESWITKMTVKDKRKRGAGTVLSGAKTIRGTLIMDDVVMINSVG